jgi:hypothetical protein
MSECADVATVTHGHSESSGREARCRSHPLPCRGCTDWWNSLDGLYESIDEAWTDALNWWQGRGLDACSVAGAIGVEVSTPAGEWRTLLMRSQGLHRTGG